MKKTAKSLAKDCDFNSSSDYFNYCFESMVNGQYAQTRMLVNNLRKSDQKDLLEYARTNFANDEFNNLVLDLI